MPYVYKVLTLNINGIRAASRKTMLAYFLLTHNIDIALLQEVVCPEIVDLPSYTTWINIGTNLRVTAILTRTGLLVDEVRRLPKGTGIAISIQRVWYVRVYAPSGAERRADREAFFNTKLPLIWPATPTALLLVGDFNCIINRQDSTGNVPRSVALETFVRGMELHDMGGQ
jgi:exonuclease III